MIVRIVKILVAWNVVLTVLLLISFAGNAALIQAANDPPVRVYTATLDDVGADSGLTSGTTVSSTGYTPIASVVTNALSINHQHNCMVIGSVGADFSGNGKYSIGIGYDASTSLLSNSKREFEFLDTAGNDYQFLEATTLHNVSSVAGSHTFYLLAKKNNSGSADLVVDEARILVMCFKKTI